MDVKYYPVIIERGETDSREVGFGVFFPDLPGCASGGETVEEALIHAGEALELHLSAMVKDGEKIPPPSPLSKIEQDPEVEEVLRTLVRVDIPTRWVNVTIPMAETLLHRIDSIAEERGMTRSNFLSEAARRMVEPI